MDSTTWIPMRREGKKERKKKGLSATYHLIFGYTRCTIWKITLWHFQCHSLFKCFASKISYMHYQGAIISHTCLRMYYTHQSFFTCLLTLVPRICLSVKPILLNPIYLNQQNFILFWQIGEPWFFGNIARTLYLANQNKSLSQFPKIPNLEGSNKKNSNRKKTWNFSFLVQPSSWWEKIKRA